MRRLIFSGILVLFVIVQAHAQKGKKDEDVLQEEALELFEDGAFAKAYPLYSQLVSLQPGSADFNYHFGVCAMYAGVEKSKAIQHLEYAKKKGFSDKDLHFYLGRARHLNYEFDLAITSYQAYQAKVTSKDKVTFDAERAIQMCQEGKMLLTNLRDIVVLEKTATEQNDFFRYFDLSEIGGKILSTPPSLQTKFDSKQEFKSVIHYPSTATTIYFASYGDNANTGKDLYRAHILPGGEFSKPEKLPSSINTKYDEDFAFMHPDGKTFYFASKGHNSMGGYDIFKSEYNFDNDSWSTAVNLDFAINTPDDDLFYVADSTFSSAYFASSRSSSQGELHVYKVMVKGIPIQVTFVKGDFISEVNEGKIADIKIYDETTGRPILETTTDNVQGDYLLSFPKAGLYKYEVEEENSSIIHEGIVEIPSFDHPVALAQELKIINDGGLEKLIITNYFEEELDIDLAALTAEMLRDKSGLDVNANEEILQELENSTLEEDVDVSTAPIAAGFGPEDSIESITSNMRSSSEEMKQEALKLQDLSGNALALATGDFQKADSLIQLAKVTMNGANESNQEEYIQSLLEYESLLTQAYDIQLKASNAIKTGEKMNEFAADLLFKASQLDKNADDISTFSESGNMDAMVETLTLEKERIREITKDVPTDTAVELITEADILADANARKVIEIQAARENITNLERSIEIENQSLANTSKKKEQEVISQKIEQLNLELQAERDQLEKSRLKAEDFGLQERDLRQQANIYREVYDNLSEIEKQPWEKGNAESLASEITSAISEIDELRIDDEETLALISDAETKATRNDIETLVVAEVDEPEQLELKPVKNLKEGFQKQGLMISESEVGVEIKNEILAQKTIISIDEEIERLKTESLSGGNLENGALAGQISELEEWKSELETQLSANTISSEPFSETDFLNEIENIDQDYVQRISDINNLTESELESEILLYKNDSQALSDAKDKVEENYQSMLSSDDTAELEALKSETEQYERLIQNLEANVDGSTRFQIAYENENKSIIESEADYSEKLYQQIELTENYVAILEEIEGENEEVDAQIVEANQKLSSYQSDLELSLNAEERPEDVSTESTPMSAEVTVAKTNQELIQEVKPNYIASLEDLDVADIDQNEKAKRTIALNQSLIGQLYVERDNKTEELDASNSESERDLIQVEIQNIQSLIDAKTAESIALSSTIVEEVDVDNASEEVVNAIPIEEYEATTDLVFETTQVHPEDIRDNVTYDELISDLAANDEQFAEQEAQIETKKFEIEMLSEQLNLESSNGKKKKIDRKIQNTYFDIAKAEVNSSKRIADESDRVYEEREAILIEALAANDAELNSNDWLKNEVEMAIAESEQLMEEADAIRELAAPEMDDIKQAYQYNQAVSMELKALEQQKRALAMVENRQQIAQFEPEALNMMKYGEIPENAGTVASLLIADNSTTEIDESIEDSRSSEETASEEIASEETTSEEATSEVEISENNVQEDVVDGINESQPEIDSSAEDTTFESNENSAVVVRDFTESDTETDSFAGTGTAEESFDTAEEPEVSEELVVELPESLDGFEAITIPNEDLASEKLNPEVAFDDSMSAEEVSKIKTQSAYVAYVGKVEELREKEATQINNVEARMALYDATLELERRVAKLEASAALSDDVAEQEGILEEVKKLRAAAEVNYTALAAMDETINSDNDAIAAFEAELLADLAEIKSAEFVASIESEEIPTVIPDDIVESNTAVIEESTSNAPANVPSTKPAASSNYEDYLFSYPEVLENEIFAFTNAPAYDDNNPIPLNVDLPKGIVFKVQVGAFRNQISPSVFGAFAPLAGEPLSNGITRYTAGLFTNFTSADFAKSEIRDMGYNDAFVVAFKDGVRISVGEAKELAVNLESVAVNTSVSNTSTNSNQGNNSETPSSDVAAVTQPNTNSSASNSSVAETESLEEDLLANTISWEVQEGLFYTVQVGVYSKAIDTDVFNAIPQLYSERTSNGFIRYTSGRYDDLSSAKSAKEAASNNGVQDAFVTAYLNGERISVSQAQNTVIAAPIGQNVEYEIIIGTFTDEVPSKIARAMLMLEAKLGIYQEINGDESTYLTRKVSSYGSIESAMRDFSNYEVSDLSVQGYINGEAVSLEQARGAE